MSTLTSLELSIIETGASAYMVNGRLSWIGGEPVRAAVSDLCRRGLVETVADVTGRATRATVPGRDAAAQARRPSPALTRAAR